MLNQRSYSPWEVPTLIDTVGTAQVVNGAAVPGEAGASAWIGR
ncbi:hypothetical protein AB0O22_26175 [Streptomyces sp. NPDC091204]